MLTCTSEVLLSLFLFKEYVLLIWSCSLNLWETQGQVVLLGLRGGCDKGSEILDRHRPLPRSALVKTLCNAAITAHKSTSLHLGVH